MSFYKPSNRAASMLLDEEIRIDLVFKNETTIGGFQATLLALNYSLKSSACIDLGCRQFSLESGKKFYIYNSFKIDCSRRLR